MALVNTAHVLAREGWRVLMVDFDLEAPGMTHFFAQEVRKRPEHVRKDALDLLLDAKRSLQQSDQAGTAPEYSRSLAEYVVPLSLPKEWLEGLPDGIPYRNGRLDLIPATLEPQSSGEVVEKGPPVDYMERLGELDLAGLFQETGPGHRFGDHVRNYFVSARFEAPGDILFTLRERVKAAYDIVVIDSRTGLNEVAGFSIGTITDALVICCGLNEQNIAGTRYFMEKTGLFDQRKAKPFLLAAGPVPPWSTKEVNERLKRLRRVLRFRQGSEPSHASQAPQLEADNEGLLDIAHDSPQLIEIPYHPLAAVREVVFVTELPQDIISQAYKALALQIRVKLSPGAVERLEKKIRVASLRDSGQKDLRSATKLAAAKLPQSRLFGQGLFPLPAFPTAWGVGSLPSRSRRRRNPAWQLPICAAVAAQATGSAQPLERAWLVIHSADSNAYRRLTASSMAYFQASTRHRLPPHATALFSTLTAEGSREAYDYASTFSSHLAGVRLASTYNSISVKEIGENSLKVAARRVFHLYLRYFCPNSLFSSAYILFLRAMEEFARGTLRDDEEALDFLRSLLPAKATKLFQGDGEEARRGVPIEDTRLANFLPSIWPEPLAATIVAITEGSNAVKRILEWLHLARSRYGYAWRVLLDWRYFEEVKEHPQFQEFLREEDEIVEAVEAAIDRGDYPL
jgi:hypothetical protein